LKLVLSAQYPEVPPRGFFLTKIYHPNVADNGDICVNTLKKDWTTEVTIKHIFQVIRCLLIVPFPESSLNCEAGKSYTNFFDLVSITPFTESFYLSHKFDIYQFVN
jgi:ubiquitin-conjugating enzyme E2 S